MQKLAKLEAKKYAKILPNLKLKKYAKTSKTEAKKDAKISRNLELTNHLRGHKNLLISQRERNGQKKKGNLIGTGEKCSETDLVDNILTQRVIIILTDISSSIQKF